MHTFILQDWITIRGGTGVTTITQPETSWLDLEPFQDVVFWVDVKESTGGPSLFLQTSPTLDETFFQSMTNASMVAAAAPTLLPAFMMSAAVPLARYVRWLISGMPTWDATFRIVVAANSPGM
jgi:hypothetical protein